MASVPERVRPSATVILVRRTPRLEVYLVERSTRTRFFPGYHAFPGGVLDPADGEGESSRRQAALRELFEETGVLATDKLPPHDLPREAARADPALLAEAFRAHGLAWATSRLIEAGRLLTPPFGPLRYDTSFFFCELPPGETPSVDGTELVSGRFVAPREALERWDLEAMPIPPPTLAFLRLLAQKGDVEAVAAAARATDGRPHHERFRIELHPGIYALPLKAPTLPPATTQNCYIIDGDPVLIVDPGTPHDEERVALFHTLDHMLDGREAIVLLTHHHGDHWGSVEALQERYGFRVLAHRATKDRLPPHVVDGVIADGHELDVGTWRGRPWRVKVLETPGHAPGHLAFRDQRFGAVLAGDLVSGISTILIDPVEGNMSEYMASLSRLADLKPHVVLPGHGPVLPGGAFAATLEHRRMRETRILEALSSEPREPEDLVPTVYADTPQEAWGLAARSLESHLIDLARRGFAVRSDGGYARGHRHV